MNVLKEPIKLHQLLFTGAGNFRIFNAKVRKIYVKHVKSRSR